MAFGMFLNILGGVIRGYHLHFYVILSQVSSGGNVRMPFNMQMPFGGCLALMGSATGGSCQGMGSSDVSLT